LFGIPIGDRLLSLVADRLRQGVHGGNLVARLGGDEFAVGSSAIRRHARPAASPRG
jgi:GGDEF domain-containing protein